MLVTSGKDLVSPHPFSSVAVQSVPTSIPVWPCTPHFINFRTVDHDQLFIIVIIAFGTSEGPHPGVFLNPHHRPTPSPPPGLCTRTVQYLQGQYGYMPHLYEAQLQLANGSYASSTQVDLTQAGPQILNSTAVPSNANYAIDITGGGWAGPCQGH